jgi:hypothetical protein
MPPPLLVAELPEKMLLVSVDVPGSFQNSPASCCVPRDIPFFLAWRVQADSSRNFSALLGQEVGTWETPAG